MPDSLDSASTPASASTRIRRSWARMLFDLGSAAALLAVSAVPALLVPSWLTWIVSIFLAAGAGLTSLGLAFQQAGVAGCPGCGARLFGLSLQRDNAGHQCERCLLFVESEGGRLVPTPEQRSAKTPVFGVVLGLHRGDLPELCCTCAAPATRRMPLLIRKRPQVDLPCCDAHERGARIAMQGPHEVLYVRSLAFARALAARHGGALVGTNRRADRPGEDAGRWDAYLGLGFIGFGVVLRLLLGWAERADAQVDGKAIMVILYLIFGKDVLAGIFISLGSLGLVSYGMRQGEALRRRLGLGGSLLCLLPCLFPLPGCAGHANSPSPAPSPAGDAGAAAPRPAATPEGGAPKWRLVHHETFDAAFNEPAAWIEDTYGDASPYHVDAFDEDGEFFVEAGGEVFREGLRRFRSFRKFFAYGEGGWLTVELYGRDSDRDGTPETGGRFVSEGGKARLISTRHDDAAMVRSTRPLPRRYRLEVTVSNIDFGGVRHGSWDHGGMTNGYDGDEIADPWRFRDGKPAPLPATSDNGVYFLCITDYARPAPHNNVFIHHHRKVVMDTDNNLYKGSSWSRVWNPLTKQAEEDGSHYISMIWLNGESFGSHWTGNDFTSYTPGGWMKGAIFVDKYLDGESYVFAIERDGDAYTMSVSGRFHHGGAKTYEASRKFREPPVTWHYNQDPAEYTPPHYNEKKTYGGRTFDTWPEGSAYPDHFFFGDPHINYYEGTAEFDDLKLYEPVE